MKRARSLTLLALIIAATLIATGCANSGDEKVTLKVICAGSLMVPFEEMEKAFEAQHPDVDVLIEGHGSIQVIRHVTELDETADVLAVADYSLIPMMMYNLQVPGTDRNYSDWYVKFATNRLGLAYTSNSKHADQINSSNWYEILSEPDVKLGIPDARFDSCGYRALMLCQLAESYYGDDTIFESVLGTFSPPVTITAEGELSIISVPEILKPEKITVRGSSVVLLGILESGDIDYAFEYKSVAEQHGLKFLELPLEIDLSCQDFADQYLKVRVEMDFQRFASVSPEFVGEPIIYGLTLPANAPHSESAIQFAEFIVGPEGQQIMAEVYHPPISPPIADYPDRIPSALQLLL